MSCIFTFTALQLQLRLDTICNKIIAFGEHTPYHRQAIRILHRCNALRVVFPYLGDAWQEHIVLSLDQFVSHIDDNWSDSSLLDVVLHMSADLSTLEDWITGRCLQIGVAVSTDPKVEQEADWQDRLVLAEHMLKQDVFVRDCMELKGAEAYTMIHVMQSVLDSTRPADPHRYTAFEILHTLCTSTHTFQSVGIPILGIKSGSEAVSPRGAGLVSKGYLLSGQLITASAFGTKAEKRFGREVLLWHQLSHPFVLPLLGITDAAEPGLTKMISPWCQNGNLAQYLRHPGASSVNRLQLLYQVCVGLSYLHDHVPIVIHTNLKCANVLIQDDGSPCLADMCLSLDTLHTGPRLESTRWMAVERLAGEEYERATMRKESDIWSLGTLVLEAFTGTVPYPHIPDSAYVAARVVSGERPVRPVGWDVVKYGMDDDLWDLLCACWDSDVSRRPTLGRVAGVVRRLAGAWVGGAGT